MSEAAPGSLSTYFIASRCSWPASQYRKAIPIVSLLLILLAACSPPAPPPAHPSLDKPNATQTPARAPSPTAEPTQPPAAAASPIPTHTTAPSRTPVPSLTPISTEKAACETETTFRVEGGQRLYLGEGLLIDLSEEAPNSLGLGAIRYSPTCERFLLIVVGVEGDDRAFLFSADGSGKTEITGEGDKIRESTVTWAPDGSALVYERINTCLTCASPAPTAPPEGLVRYNVGTGDKTILLGERMVNTLQWSPDGSWIAYSHGIDPPIFILDAAESGFWKLEGDERCYGLRWVWEIPQQTMSLLCSVEIGPPRSILQIEADAAQPPAPPAEKVSYQVVGAEEDGGLPVFTAPREGSPEAGMIPPDGVDILVTGAGAPVGNVLWVPVIYGELSGWVDSSYLAVQL